MERFDELIGPLREKLEAVTPHLNERQRRLLYAAEARQFGHGGISAVARAAGVSKGCVGRGLAELETGDDPDGRVRRPGSGRPAAAERDPGLRAALLALVEDSTQGDPIARVDLVCEVRSIQVGDLVRVGVEASMLGPGARRRHVLRQWGQAHILLDPFDESKPGRCEQVANFEVYKDLEPGKSVDPDSRWSDRMAAEAEITASRLRWADPRRTQART
jgi:hypothetical protein